MRNRLPVLPAVLLMALGAAPAMAAPAPAAAAAAYVPLAQRIGHYVAPTERPPNRPPGQGAHQGNGRLTVTRPMDMKSLSGDWWFYQRGILWDKSTIGVHFHQGTEEMFVILDGDAEYTIDDNTAVVKGPAGVPVRLTHAHARLSEGPFERPSSETKTSL